MINPIYFQLFSAEELNIEALNADLPQDIKIFGAKRVTKGFNAKDQCNARTYSYTVPTIAFARFDETPSLKDYRVPSERIDRVNELLKMFHGNKNFHNFTARKLFSDPSSFRLIYIFECGPPHLVNGVELATIVVKGQSFMLHQIRKMIGLMLAVVREVTTTDTILRAFKEPRIDVPMAPGLGLVLDQVHYDRYNSRYGADGFHENLVWDDFDAAVEEFRAKFIQPKIAESELAEAPMQTWLSTLERHSYDERMDRFGASVDVGEGSSSGDDEGCLVETSVSKGKGEDKSSHAVDEDRPLGADSISKSALVPQVPQDESSISEVETLKENESTTLPDNETSKTSPETGADAIVA